MGRRRRDRTPSSKPKRTPSATVFSPAPKRWRVDRYVSPGISISASSETIKAEGSHTRREKQEGQQKALEEAKAFEETSPTDKHISPPGQEEQGDLPLDHTLHTLEPTGGVSEDVELLNELKETNKGCNLVVQLMRNLADNPEETKAFEETTENDKHGSPPGQEEQGQFPLDHALHNLEPTGGVSEDVGLLNALKQTNKGCSPTCNPVVQLIRIQADNPKETKAFEETTANDKLRSPPSKQEEGDLPLDHTLDHLEPTGGVYESVGLTALKETNKVCSPTYNPEVQLMRIQADNPEETKAFEQTTVIDKLGSPPGQQEQGYLPLDPTSDSLEPTEGVSENVGFLNALKETNKGCSPNCNPEVQLMRIQADNPEETNAFDQTTVIDKHGSPPGQQEQGYLPLDHTSDSLEPTGGVSENGELSNALKETNKSCSPNCNPEVQLMRIQADNTEEIKVIEETTVIDKHGSLPGQQEQGDLPLDHTLDSLEPTGGVSENVGSLNALKETNKGCFPTYNPNVQLMLIQADNPVDASFNMTLGQAPTSTFIPEIDANTSACILQVQHNDQDIYLTSRVEEIQINPQIFQINETSSTVFEEDNKSEKGRTDPKSTNKITSQELMWVSEVMQLDDTFYTTIANDNYKLDEPLKPGKNHNLALISPNNPTFQNNEEILRKTESNGFSDATVNVQARHLPCCNSAAALTNQNDALRKEIQSLQNEIASLSCQMFDLEAKCSKLESINQQLQFTIREYAELGSREEILSCGQQIEQFVDFVQAMLEEIPTSHQNLNYPSGTGPSCLHTLH